MAWLFGYDVWRGLAFVEEWTGMYKGSRESGEGGEDGVLGKCRSSKKDRTPWTLAVAVPMTR
jgi:hypothetical protein